MNLPLIYNRDGGLANDGWIQIVPKGELPNRDAGIVQVLDDPALDSIIASLQADQRRLGNRWPGLYIGEEHFIYDDSKSSQAFGWAKEFQKREDGIWAKPEWTDIGDDAVKNRRFKYTSFVADPKDLQPLEGKRARILRIESVGLTNFANGRQMLAPITNRDSAYMNPDGTFKGGFDGCVLHMMNVEGHDKDSATRICGYIAQQVKNRELPDAGASARAENQNKRTTMKSVATKLGLSADASEEAVLAEVTKILNRATEAEGKVAPMQLRVTELEGQNKSLLTEQVEAILEGHGIKDEKIVNRLRPVLLGLKDRAERTAFLADVVAAPKDGAKGRVINRESAKTPAEREGAASGQELDQSELARQQSEAIDDYRVRNRCTYEAARAYIRRTKPELFGLDRK